MSIDDRFLPQMQLQHLILFVIVLDFPPVLALDLTRDCLVFLKDRQVSRFGCYVFELSASFSRFGCFVFESWVLRFRVSVLRFRGLGASFSRLGCFVFEVWVLLFRDFGASCFDLHFRMLCFRNYHLATAGRVKQRILCCRKFIIIFGSSDLSIEQSLALAECRIFNFSFRTFQKYCSFSLLSLSRFCEGIFINMSSKKNAFVRVFTLTIRHFETRFFKTFGKIR